MTDAARSESHELSELSTILKRVAGERGVNAWAHRTLWGVIHRLDALAGQAKRGVHRNPPLVFNGNPPMRVQSGMGIQLAPLVDVGEISHEAHAILYRHLDDGKTYRHDFERPTWLLAVKRAGQHEVLIASPRGDPIWQEF